MKLIFLVLIFLYLISRLIEDTIPATILVVQIEPGPMPILIISAPLLIKNLAASGVATLPTHIEVFFLILLFFSMYLLLF